MKFLWCKLLFLALLPLTAGEVMNLNSSMELGVPGKGVPGFLFDVNKLHIKEGVKDYNKTYAALTVPGGKNGNCLMIPGYTGVSGYQLESSEMILPRDGEVEISFDAKIGPDENGVLHKAKPFAIDFRCFPDLDKDRYYPMLKRYNFRPTTEWKTFTKRFNIKGYTYYYFIWVMPSGLKSGETGNSLYLDNFKLRYVDGKDVEPEEYAVIPDRDDQIYTRGEKVKFDLRARLNSNEKSVKATLLLKKDYNGEVIRKMPVELTRQSDGTYVGAAEITLDLYGSFATELIFSGKKPNGINGSVVSLHPVIKHPFGSFGWRMGFNHEGFWAAGRTGYDAWENFRVEYGSLERLFRIMKHSGSNISRVWGKWRMIEPYEGQMSTALVGFHLAMLKKYNFEPLYCLAGNFPVHGGKSKIESYHKNDGRGSNFPRHLWKYYHQSNVKNMGSILPPMEIYKKHLEFVYKTWGKDIRLWEMSNEPGIHGVPADRYIAYLKETYKYIKEKNPNAVLLGNGVTGDFGMNVVKWCDQLNAADRNYVDYLDGIAFHPYACGLDYLNGSRDLYKQCVKNISSTLAKPKPMWNTECYYLPTVRKKQLSNAREYSRFNSNELQRHYLDGFCNNVMGSPSFAASSFFQHANRIVNLSGPTELVAASNALSFMLKEMVNVEEISINRHVRCGIFTDKQKSKALGFIYDMRPAGSTWNIGKAKVTVLDLYGNKVDSSNIKLSYEPYYISGSYSEVAKALKNSTFKVDFPVEFTGRFFNDVLFAEVRNSAGTSGLVEGMIGKTPAVFDFRNNSEYTVVCLGKVKEVPPQFKMVERTPGHTLPYSATLANGSKISVSVQGEYLKLTAEVAESNLKPAPHDQLWSGSAVELFVDPAPFLNLKVEKVKILQYIFAPVASDSGITTKAIHNSKSKASCSTVVSDGKYVLTALVPLSELPASHILGFDVVINKRGVKQKESIGNDPNNSFQRRNHYHLFEFPERRPLGNCDFSADTMGDPEYWCYSIKDGVKVDVSNGVGTIEVNKPQSAPIYFHQDCKVTPGKYKRATLQVTLKYDGIENRKPGRGRHGVQMAVNYRGNASSYSVNSLKKDIVGSSDWQIYQLDFKIPAKTNYLMPNVGIGANTTGKVTVSDIKLILWEK